jgi:hypothetical protein
MAPADQKRKQMKNEKQQWLNIAKIWTNFVKSILRSK